MCPGTCGTAGGLTINENAQVVNVNGEPIEHLYAVATAPPAYRVERTCTAASAWVRAPVMSWVAVNHALAAKA